MLPDFCIAPVRRVLHGKEADIYSCSASKEESASFFGQVYGNYYHLAWITTLSLSSIIHSTSESVVISFLTLPRGLFTFSLLNRRLVP